jgi:hypothetical protein
MSRARHKLLALTAIAVSASAAAGDGAMCIGPVPKATGGQKSLANATASAVPYEFYVAIGDREPIATSHTESQLISGLDTSKSHLVVIRQGAKRVASFRLTFEGHKADSLCLWFGPLYESWSVWPLAQSRGKCSCAVGMSSNTSLERTREG